MSRSTTARRVIARALPWSSWPQRAVLTLPTQQPVAVVAGRTRPGSPSHSRCVDHDSPRLGPVRRRHAVRGPGRRRPGFGSPEVSAATVNSVYVPDRQRSSSATNYWRVRAVHGRRDRSDWATGLHFDHAAAERPVPSAPSTAPTSQQPDNPPAALPWTAVPGRQSYPVEVDGDSDFVGAMDFTTKTTSLVVDRPLGRRRLVLARHRAQGTRPQCPCPAPPSTFWHRPARDAGDHRPAAPAGRRRDLELRTSCSTGSRCAGAIAYELQVVHQQRLHRRLGARGSTSEHRVLGTRFSPPSPTTTTSYYWRVRAVDPPATPPPWARPRVDFNRHLARRPPDLVLPGANGADHGRRTRSTSSGTPVTNASEYEI